MKICPKCGTSQDDRINYCMNCGNKFSVPTLSQQSQLPQQFQQQPQFQYPQPTQQQFQYLPQHSPQLQQNLEKIHSTNKEKDRDKVISIILNIVLISLLFLQLTVAPLSFFNEDDEEDYKTKYKNLKTEYQQLQLDYDRLQNNTLRNLQTQYENLTSDYQNLTENYNEVLDSYYNLRENVISFFYEMRMRSPASFQRSNFITPDDPAVQDLLETILGNDADGDLTWSDQEKIYDFINDRKDYSYDPYAYYPYLWFDDSVINFNFPEFWSYPNETIKRYNESGVFAGDCEDFTNLLISLFFAEENNNYTFGITLDTDPYEEGGGHATCFVRITGGDIYIYDIAGDYMDGNKGSAEDTLEDYGYHWHWWYSDIDIWSAYNPHCSKEFEDNDEFLEWWEI